MMKPPRMSDFLLGVLTYMAVDQLVRIAYSKWARYQRRKYKQQCREYDKSREE